MKIQLTSEQIREAVAEPRQFVKYVSPILNLTNRFAQATRPSIVGQMSELIKQWEREHEVPTFQDWKAWYGKNRPGSIDAAVDKMKEMLEKFRDVIAQTDDDTIRRWVEDLVITQTFIGFRFQEAILRRLSSMTGKDYRMAKPDEESKGIDGYVGGVPVSVKPETYKLESAYSEKIEPSIIYYRKGENETTFTVDDALMAKLQR